jgi:magnesium transporter
MEEQIDDTVASASDTSGESAISALVAKVQQRAPRDAVLLLEQQSDSLIAAVLSQTVAASAIAILAEFSVERAAAIKLEAPPEKREQWLRNEAYHEGSVGRLMEPALAIFRPEESVAAAVAWLRNFSDATLVTYGHVTSTDDRLLGVIVMRDLLLASPDQTLESLMVRDPFTLNAAMPVADASPLVLHRHYPVYPVCDGHQHLLGVVRGYVLFEEQAIEMSAQPGRMVGVEDEERLSTPWWRCLRFRHPWLQLNLFTAFIAASVVGAFQDTLDKFVVLAVFLPVLAGQSGNTGLQSLAVTIRGMTLGELKDGSGRKLVRKEALVGLLNGLMVGLTAGLGMYLYARFRENPDAQLLGLVVFLAMAFSCVMSGVSGTLIPIALRRAGVDPATASSIFLTTLTDVASMGVFLGLATLLLL